VVLEPAAEWFLLESRNWVEKLRDYWVRKKGTRGDMARPVAGVLAGAAGRGARSAV